MTFIKQEPVIMQEEQEDLIMSYLNTDYLTEQPLSPPDSTTSSEATGSPDKQMVDDFIFDQTQEVPLEFLNTNWSNPLLFNSCMDQNNDLFSFYLNPITQIQEIEQPKKKRGRKKREVTIQTTPPPPSLLAPKPLAPKPDTLIKIEPIPLEEPPKDEQQKIKVEQQLSVEIQKQLQIQKRQERLIKNRAAALLSRKRKREHLNSLEDENKKLVEENELLSTKLSTLEDKIQSLEKENSELKSKLYSTHENNNTLSFTTTKKTTKAATSVVFMMMLFSFALFSLPSRSHLNTLTVGGSVFESKSQLPLIASSSFNPIQGEKETTDLILIDSVRPRDLQTWINHKLDVSQHSKEEETLYSKFIDWLPSQSKEEKNNQSHVYLYSKEFSQLASSYPVYHQDSLSLPPLISIFSPYNQTVDEDQCDSYLQIDVQVLRSTVIKGHLSSLDKVNPTSIALLDGMKNEIINNDTFQKERERRLKKISRVL